ncbi:MAG: helicase-related protein [Bacteroidota bacterium]
MEEVVAYLPKQGERVKVKGREDLGVGEVLRVSDTYGIYQADIVFESPDGRRLESFPVERLEPAPDLWDRLRQGTTDKPIDFLLKQLAFQFPLQNTGGQLSNSRTHLLPHQILLTRDLVSSKHRRYLIADEVGLGKTIEVGMILRELQTRGEAERILIITPAGLTKNWQQELRDSFRLHFEILGIDFIDRSVASWEMHNRVIASIDALKRTPRLERLLSGPRWDVVVIDEAHHLSRLRYGAKIQTTQNFRLAESLRSHTRDLLFLSATPHQGNTFQFWSLIQLLDDSLFDSEESMMEHRGLLNRVMIRRTKREVTDRHGKPIFMRRQVHTQSFQQAARERMFYEKLTEYLREGYSAAGLGQSKTTSEQRAIGFVMTTFQKIMSSSLRAIRQALRRRLLVLLIRHQLELENRRRRNPANTQLAGEIVRLQDEMRQVASEILGIQNSASKQPDIDAFIAQTRQRVSKKFSFLEETTEWALDADEEADEGVFASGDIPDEINKVRGLLGIIPEGTDRKFDTLRRAIDDIRRQSPNERFVIFTQYRETLEFLKEELGKVYGPGKVAAIKGGPLDEKIEAVERFWEDGGAQFLVSTSAGGEGINLQVGHILFNYDLPWNPMALEQRIGRIHRYGQTDTVQVYNLVAEDTVEEKIYQLLESKLEEIARQIGKIDPVTHEPREDFRTEILGFLGSSPNYLELYKRALVDKDYARTEREIAEAIEKARQASEALSVLAQDLRSFDLGEYLNIEGKFSLDDLKQFVEAAVLRLGGAMLPRGEFYKIETPKVLQKYPNVLPRYELVAFDRDAAMRKRTAELFGLGHPFVDALIDYLQQVIFPGDVTVLNRLTHESEPYVVVNTLLSIDLEDGTRHQEIKTIRVSYAGDAQVLPDDWTLKRLEQGASSATGSRNGQFDFDLIRRAYEGAIGAILTQVKLSLEKPVGARVRLVGLAMVN